MTVTGSGSETLRAIQTWGVGSAAIAVGDGGHIYEKTSGGSTFDPVDPGLAPAVTAPLHDVAVFVNGSDVDLRICGSSGALLFRDAGTWDQVRSYTSFPLYKLAFQSADEGFAIGQSFVILKYE